MSVPADNRANVVIRKKLFKTIKDFGFRITVEVNMIIVQFLDVEFNLSAYTVSPYFKPNTSLKYVNTRFNHPANVIRYIPKGVECRIFCNSSTKEIFQFKKWYMKMH